MFALPLRHGGVILTLVVGQFESLQELSFRSAAVSREESAVLVAKADSSPINRFGMITLIVMVHESDPLS
jgi:hypothetical protein